MINQLLTSKLFAPPTRPGLVSRPRLLQKMDLGLQGGARMTLITAPAGYGKTTLTLEWLERLGRSFCWLSLDPEDNHPVPLLTYLIAALGQVDDRIYQTLLSERAAPYGPDDADWVQACLLALVNYLAGIQSPFILVLDDYHTITDLAIHQVVSFLLEHVPPQMHLVLNSRQDPLLPLARFRSRGQVTEVRLGDLRFTQEEAGLFLNGTMGLDLIPEQVASLECRTEGWIAGLQLAAISLSEAPAWTLEPPDSTWRARFIQEFAGDDRHVVDYLMDEVLSRQPEQIQRFLLRTSVLRRLSGPLCDAILENGEPGADTRHSEDIHGSRFADLGSRSSPSQSILEYLERANLFIIPLDSRRQWYRYHHLFAELLTSRLQASNPRLVPALHSQASRWFEKSEMTDDAVDHALLAEDFDRALGLIEHTAVTSVWTSGDLLDLLTWFRRLPEDALITRPRLCLYYARALFFAGQQMDTADRYLNEAERALRARMPDPKGEEWGMLLTNRAAFASLRGDSHKAIELARQARPHILETDYSSLARLGHAEGMAYYLLGEVRKAEPVFSQAIHAGWHSGNRNLALDCISCLALTQALSGRLRQAIRICKGVLAEDPENPRAAAACTVRFALAEGLYEQNELGASQQILETDLGSDRKFGRPHILWQVYLLLARVRRALEDPPGALEALEQAREATDRFAYDYAARIVSAGRARIDLADGNLTAALSWAETYQRLEPAERERDFEDLTFARVLLSTGSAPQAVAVLDRILEAAKADGRTASEIEAYALRSIVLDHLSDHEAAMDALLNAIRLAEPESFLRVFLDSGNAMSVMVSRIQRMKVPASVVSFAGRLLSAFPQPGAEPGSSPASAMESLIDPLSERELEVLRLIAEGLSNPEIAARLYLSVNTLRAHASNIYQKLDVHNRVQAVTRAKELGLLIG